MIHNQIITTLSQDLWSWKLIALDTSNFDLSNSLFWQIVSSLEWFYPINILRSNYSIYEVQQGLEIRGFWFLKKTVQLKTALREVYTYVLNGIFFQKTV